MKLSDYIKLEDLYISGKQDIGVIVADELNALFNKFLENPEIKPKFHIFHDTDMDGITAYVQFYQLITKILGSLDIGIINYPLTSGHHFKTSSLDKLEDVVTDHEENVIVILDHGLNSAVFKKAQEKAKYLIWVDHHMVPTNEDLDIEFNDEDTVLYLTRLASTSGKMLEILSKFPDEKIKSIAQAVYPIVYLVDYHDTWQYDEDENNPYNLRSRSLNNWFYVANDTKDEFIRILNRIANEHEAPQGGYEESYRIIYEGENYYKCRQLVSTQVAKSHVVAVNWKLDDFEYKVGLAFHSDDMSSLGQIILSEHPELNAAVMVNVSNKTKRARMNMRSRRDVDVQKLASFFGGGGHRNASGAEIPMIELSQYLQDTVLR